MDILIAIENYNNNKGKLADIWDSAKELQTKLRKRNTQIADLKQRLKKAEKEIHFYQQGYNVEEIKEIIATIEKTGYAPAFVSKGKWNK